MRAPADHEFTKTVEIPHAAKVAFAYRPIHLGE